MKIASIVSTKGGPGKTTVTANLGAFCADANLKTLLIDLVRFPIVEGQSCFREHDDPCGYCKSAWARLTMRVIITRELIHCHVRQRPLPA